MKTLAALEGGLAGSLALSILHETIKRLDPDSPRMDLLGMEAIAKTLKKADSEVPEDRNLFIATLIGDIISNSIYYSLAGIGKKKNTAIRGGLLGLAAGLGAIVLPRYLGLNPENSNRTSKTKVYTAALYLTGGLVAAAAMMSLNKKRKLLH
jgi:hypothetical protein